MQKVLPQPTRADKLDALRAAIQEAQRLGVTSVQNAGGSPEDLGLFEELRAAGDLQVRVYAALSVTSETTLDEMHAIDAARRKYQDDPLFKAGAVKLMADGVIESHTAAMLAPYANKATTGAPYFSPDDLARLVGDARQGWLADPGARHRRRRRADVARRDRAGGQNQSRASARPAPSARACGDDRSDGHPPVRRARRRRLAAAVPRHAVAEPDLRVDRQYRRRACVARLGLPLDHGRRAGGWRSAATGRW